MGFSIAKEGFFILFVTIAISSLFLALGLKILGTFFFILFLCELCFFRDPDRIVPDASGDAILSPADGKIIKIGGNEISIFMSLFDVHVNRAPVAGEIEKIIYREGRFRAAFLDDAQKENESNTIIVKTDRGNVTFTQIAGMIARRIVCNVKKGHRVNAGQRIGMIKFGSRVDLEMPNGVTMMVNRGEKVQSGRSIIAITKSLENV